MKDYYNLEEYFSEKEIIKILCRKRALVAKKTHDTHFLRNISNGAQNPNRISVKEINKYFPPRKDWIRLNLKERNIRNTNSLEINTIQLERTIWRSKIKHLSSGLPQPAWLLELNKFIKDIQYYALNTVSNYQIPKPKIYPILKNREKNEYRPISSFDLKDLILIGQFSKYLTNCFDKLFLDCSYAFRTSRNNSRLLNHHNAVKDIISFNKSRTDNLYVAECDIKKFFDCINHSIIKEQFNKFVQRAKEELKISIDARAINVFDSYLNCFSFNIDISKNENELLKTYGIQKGSIPWVSSEELLRVESNPEIDKIGVPQGGALSCLIANIILDYVDRKVCNADDTELFYARFCDDMVLIHFNKSKCDEIFQVYQNALTEVKLISHKADVLKGYNSSFWDKKSKSPYCWNNFINNDIEKRNNVPWVAFVGYQIRFDNLIRIRKSSIEKELKKQVSETDKILKVVKKGIKTNLNEKAIVFRLQQRLISMSVGRMKINLKAPSLCWTVGFKVIKNNATIKSQFIKLDRNREKQIKRLTSFISKANTSKELSSNKIKGMDYYGSKFSYFDQFIK